MTLRSEIEPLLSDFKKANGKGSMATANVALTKIIETLLFHIEIHTHPALSPAPTTFDMTCGPVQPPHNHPDMVPNTVSFDAGAPLSWSTIHPGAGLVTAPLGEVLSPPPYNTSLLDAVKTLHEANYVVGTDYTAIVDHLTKNPDTTPPVKVRNKPGRKPGFKKADSTTSKSKAK